MDGSVLEEKSSFKMLGLTFSSKLDWGSYIISIAKTASKKIGALIRSMKLFSPEDALYLYKSTIQSCMEYCCHVWAGAPSCYLESLGGCSSDIASSYYFRQCKVPCMLDHGSVGASLKKKKKKRNLKKSNLSPSPNP